MLESSEGSEPIGAANGGGGGGGGGGRGGGGRGGGRGGARPLLLEWVQHAGLLLSASVGDGATRVWDLERELCVARVTLTLALTLTLILTLTLTLTQP